MSAAYTIDYSKAPEEWCLAEFMATLPHVGHTAREYLKERGYSLELDKSSMLEQSPLVSGSISFRFDYARR